MTSCLSLKRVYHCSLVVSLQIIWSDSLVDLFSTPDITYNCNSVKRRLLEYYSLLQSTGLTNSVLSSLPLPPTLDPNQPVPLPSRLYTLMILFRDTVSLIIRIPFFFFPLVIHMPVYIMGRLGARLVEDEESEAQNKVVFGLLLLMMIYPSAFLFLWAFMWYTPVGALCSAAIIWLFAMYHNRLINSEYPWVSRS
jgi:glycerol-3-phosphate O-acyltransferase / dihydroxyacetone phosphate acyltransferase